MYFGLQTNKGKCHFSAFYYDCEMSVSLFYFKYGSLHEHRPCSSLLKHYHSIYNPFKKFAFFIFPSKNNGCSIFITIHLLSLASASEILSWLTRVSCMMYDYLNGPFKCLLIG